MGRLDGKVALVTGAARGQGRSHALRMAQEGADIIAVDICQQIRNVPFAMSTPEDLAETVAQVEALDRRIVARQADVRSSAQMRDAVQAGVAELGRLDVVAVNAGIFTNAFAVDMTDELWDDMIDVNMTGAFRTAQAAIPAMIEAGNGGSIIFTSSTQGLRGFAQCSHYVAAKHGVVGIMRALANELGEHRIRCNTVHPTLTDTPMVMNDHLYKMFDQLFDADNPTASRDNMGSVFEALHLLPTKWVDPVDISNAVLWLASDESRFVTGVTVPVDAGYLAQS